MVLDSLGLAGVAGGIHSLFSYNRENFMFDREMRQKQEFQILAFRNKQAELWRDDIRDIIGMTEKKMDSYLVIATLQLGMCVGLFCEGRLEPGTPPWLLAFYMMALGGAFMYLLMAVWFAMHASVVANCSSVRLLTQFVRLPVPTWEHLEDLRTYASAYESVDWQHMLRVPFTGNRGRVSHCGPEDGVEEPREEATPAAGATPAFGRRGTGLSAPSASVGRRSTSSLGREGEQDGQEPAQAADPWGLERHGNRRDLYELEDKHPGLRAHIGLARKASMQYQCFDAFARVAMTFGTNQLLNALAYYCMGYLTVQDGAVWPAWSIVIIMVSIMITLIFVDISLTATQRVLATLLQVTGPVVCVAAVTGWAFRRRRFEPCLVYMLPVAFAAHGLWLLWVLGAIGIEKLDNGSVLPMKFRAVLYLDVFGWLNGQQLQRGDGRGGQLEAADSAVDSPAEALEHRRFSGESADIEQCQEMLEAQRELHADIARWKPEMLQRGMSEGRFGPTTIAFGDGGDWAAPCPDERDAPATNGVSSKRVGGEEAVLEQTLLGDPETACRSTSGQSASRQPASLMPGVGGREASSQTLSVQDPDCTQKNPEAQRATSPNLMDAASELGTPMVKAISLLMEDDYTMSPLVENDDGLGTEKPKDPAAPSQTGPRATHSVRLPPKYAFHPSSYAPAGIRKTVMDSNENEDIVAGQETIHPGKLPAKVFRVGTAILAVLWLMGVAFPCRYVRELMTTPVVGEVYVEEERQVDGQGWEDLEVPGAMGTDPNGLPMFIPFEQAGVPQLGEGELIDVEWPVHAGFFPRALSCDDSGLRLLVADDIGLYSAELKGARPPKNASGHERPEAGRLLRGMASGADDDVPQLIARFTRVDRCSALEGQFLKDMSVVCTGTAPDDHCRALVLVSLGPTLVECSMSTDSRPDSSRSNSSESVDAPPRPSRVEHQNWTIGNDWLRRDSRHERVDALAASSDCLRMRGRTAHHPGKCAFEAESSGCVVVGTSSGRIIQLRGGMEQDRVLIPERSIHQRPTPITHGSLHVLANGVVLALSRKVSLSEGDSSEGRERKVEATAQAFDGEEGFLIGQWELPKGVDWLTLSGGGDALLALGLRDRRDLQLYRFPVPDTLKARRETAESPTSS